MKKITFILVLFLIIISSSCKAGNAQSREFKTRYNEINQSFKTYTISRTLLDSRGEIVYDYNQIITKLSSDTYSVSRYEKTLNSFPNVNKFDETNTTYLSGSLDNLIISLNIKDSFMKEIEYNNNILSFCISVENAGLFLNSDYYDGSALKVIVKYKDSLIEEIICEYQTTQDYLGHLSIFITY
jgi:hypothetical protein